MAPDRTSTSSNRTSGDGASRSRRKSRSKNVYSDDDDGESSSSSEENSNFLSRMFGSNDADEEDDDDSYTDGGDTTNAAGSKHSRHSRTSRSRPRRQQQPRRPSVGSTSSASSYDDTADDSRSEYDSDGDSDSCYDAATFMSNPALDLVARLVSNDTRLTEISIDEASITNNPHNRSNNRNHFSTNVRAAVKVAQHIADALQKTTYLKKLTLVGSWSTSVSSVVPLNSSFGNQESKENHDVSPPFLGGWVLDTLLAGLEKNSSIKTLVLQNNHRLDRHAAHVFGTAIARHGRIKQLTITQSEFVGSGLTLLLLGIQHSKTIKGLQIQHSNLGNPHPDALDSVSASLSLMNLTSLQLQDANLHDLPSLAFLLENVQRTISLVELDLSHNYLGPEGVALLAQCLAGDRVVVGSDDNGDKNRKKTGRQRREQATFHKTTKSHIQTLALVDCGITRSASVKLLANALWNDTTLTSLNISHNAFGDNGARRWRSLLEHNHSITTLQLVGCGVGAAKLHDLANKLRYNNSFLKSLGFTSDVSLAILDGVTVMESFSNEYLGGGGNAAGSGGATGS